MSKIMKLADEYALRSEKDGYNDTPDSHKTGEARTALQVEVERMEAEIATLKTVELRAKDWHKVANDRAAEIVRLHEVIDELRVDAERYRWLRDMDHWPASFDSHTAPEPVRGPELDAAPVQQDHTSLLRQALEAWQTASYGQPSHHKAMMLAMTEIGKDLK